MNKLNTFCSVGSLIISLIGLLTTIFFSIIMVVLSLIALIIPLIV
ncbi:hypothetical protein [Clostridium perfringens]|nr:hypothetical protein [Clostridium perfringens]MDK0581877.1 hypothetical protein [Clostridium perfringens]MDK0842847.1 hypothetical protein [Clostridium perfringens]MDM0696509.1 hypothetical protein [Clostridium perfringens]MDM1008171.1 hypothetical protein [Clostridium perfringens]